MNNLVAAIQGDWQAWATGAAVTVLVALLLRLAKKRKFAEKLRFSGEKCGVALSFALLRWLPPAAAEKAEEGVFVTLFDLIKAFFEGMEIGLLADNRKRNEKKGARR